MSKPLFALRKGDVMATVLQWLKQENFHMPAAMLASASEKGHAADGARALFLGTAPRVALVGIGGAAYFWADRAMRVLLLR